LTLGTCHRDGEQHLKSDSLAQRNVSFSGSVFLCVTKKKGTSGFKKRKKSEVKKRG
jgi:hypothetical protein